MGLRKLSRTVRVTITISSRLNNEITEYITRTQRFSNYPDFASFAVQYFAQQFIYEIAPLVANELQKRKEDGTQLEKLEFKSEYGDDNETTQATLAIGAITQLNTYQTMFNQLDVGNMLVFSIEYAYKSLILREEAVNKYLHNVPDDTVWYKPVIKFKELKK